MRLRNVKNAKEIVSSNEWVITKNIFNDDKPLYIEIGTGKGDFIIQMARLNPDINYIGIEKYESILIRAINKIEDIPSNLRFMCIDAGTINEYFNKNVSKIYLNFSDPWPKDRHEKRRLTYHTFLRIYDKVLKDKKHIIMKTDNRCLFEYSVSSFSKYGYVINELCCDLHKRNEEIITTEYEEKFMKLGPIYRVDVTK